MHFEWNESKNKENQRKHGISFEYAALVFEDDYRIEDYDAYHSDEEDRYDITGMVDDILFVVCTYRDGDTVRIISARKATRNERRRYYGHG